MRAVPVKSLYQNEIVVLRPEGAITVDVDFDDASLRRVNPRMNDSFVIQCCQPCS